MVHRSPEYLRYFSIFVNSLVSQPTLSVSIFWSNSIFVMCTIFCVFAFHASFFSHITLVVSLIFLMRCYFRFRFFRLHTEYSMYFYWDQALNSYSSILFYSCRLSFDKSKASGGEIESVENSQCICCCCAYLQAFANLDLFHFTNF